MRSIGISLLFLLILTCTTYGQNIRFKSAQRVTQIGIADPAMFDELMVLVPEIGSHSRNVLERQNLKPFMMPIREIGFRGDDMCYTLTSCLEYYLNLKKNYKINLSPDYISLSMAANGKALNAKDILTFMIKDGTVNAAILPYDAGEITNAVFATQKYKINNYLYLFNASSKSLQKEFETKKALIRGNPVIIELMADEAVLSFREHEWGSARSGDYRFSFIVVGFDESNKTFELRSNFGSDWANNGYISIDYNTFSQLATNGYVMVPEEYY